MKTMCELLELEPLRDYNRSLRLFEEFCDNQGIREDNISNDDISNFYYVNKLDIYNPDSIYVSKFNYNDWILETLTSHVKDKLIKSLKYILKDYYKGYNANVANKQPYIERGQINFFISANCPIIDNNSLETFELADCKLSEKVYNSLQFYNYFISSIYISDDKDIIQVKIESYFTTDARKFIKENGNIVYHITKRENVNSIFKLGLKPKVGKRKYEGGYRYFPRRVYLIGHHDNIIDNIKSVIKDKQYDENNIDYAILKINLGNHDISLWFDDASVGEFNIYTYEAIPPSLISEIQLEEIEKI